MKRSVSTASSLIHIDISMRSTLTSKQIPASHQHLFISTSSEECIEDYIANTRHKLYLLYVKPIESTSNIEENNEVSTW